jgi:hypothetical protein
VYARSWTLTAGSTIPLTFSPCEEYSNSGTRRHAFRFALDTEQHRR